MKYRIAICSAALGLIAVLAISGTLTAQEAKSSLPGLPTSLANAINNQGQMVGFSQNANGDEFSSVAWIWQNGTMTELNTLIPSGSTPYLKEALSINDRGQIAGYGVLSDGEHCGFLLTACNDSEWRCEDNAANAITTNPDATKLVMGTGRLSSPNLTEGLDLTNVCTASSVTTPATRNRQ